MSADRPELAIQVHLAEFSALRHELLEVLKWRDHLVFLSLGISGTLFSFALSSGTAPTSDTPSRYTALYLVAPLGAIFGGLWYVNTLRIYRIGVYIRDDLAPKINVILKSQEAINPAAFEVFGWESSNERVMQKWKRRLLEWVVLLSVFVLAGVAAQYAIFSEECGSFVERIQQLENPFWFATNCFVILASFVLFVSHLLYGRRHKAISSIRPQK